MKIKIISGLPGRTAVSLCFICLYISSLAQSSTAAEQKISLLFMGDIMGHDSQIWAAENISTHTWNYDDVFSYIKPLISDADMAIANLEVTLAGPPYKGYPQFSSPAALGVACKSAGIDCLVTANNHSADRGKTGITGTIFRLDSIGMPHTGTFSDRDSRDKLQPLILTKNSISVALLNYTYATNGISVPAPVIVNMLDKNLIAADILKAKKLKPDLIVLFLHWGTEYDTVPSTGQTAIAEYFLSTGVDIVIGSHPHVLQKMVWYNDGSPFQGKAIVYSLGNFISNQRKPKTDGGSMVRMEFVKSSGSIKMISAGFYLTWVYTPVFKYSQKFYILPCSEFENRSGFFSKENEYDQMKKFITDSRSLLYKQNDCFREYIYNGSGWLLNN
ncbi:MAG: CapA family protein [Bacteroidia bacterium]|nr:CapA family protein [Bacteroidia bacterium]